MELGGDFHWNVGGKRGDCSRICRRRNNDDKLSKRGVHLSLAMIVLSAIVGIFVIMMMPGILDDVAEDENLTAEEEGLDEFTGTIMGVGAIFVVVCNGICGLIIAIPLMISNNGLDNSSLFG